MKATTTSQKLVKESMFDPPFLSPHCRTVQGSVLGSTVNTSIVSMCDHANPDELVYQL